MALAGSLDLFTIWTIVLLAIGFSVSRQKTIFLKSPDHDRDPWLILVAAQVGLQSMQ